MRTQLIVGAVLYVAALLSSAAEAKPAQPPAKTQTCNPSGEWVLKVAPVPEASKCGSYKPSRKMVDEKLTIVPQASAFEVRDAGEVADQHLKWGLNALGGCDLRYQFTINNVPEGTPDIDRVDYELLEKDGVVAGITVRTNMPDPPGPAPACSEISVVVGAKKVLSVADLTIDQAKAPADFVAYYKQFIKRACKLPVDSTKKKDIVAVRMVVGKTGELKTLWLDGADQHLNENCDAVVAEGRTPVLRNPTGKDQSLEFGVHLP